MKKHTIILMTLMLIFIAACQTGETTPLVPNETNTIVSGEEANNQVEIESNEDIQVNEEAVFEGITRMQISQNNNAQSCYVAWRGEVYDLTNWLRQHPGGAQAILPYCGTVEEFEAAFQERHNANGLRDDGLLRNNAIGVLID